MSPKGNLFSRDEPDNFYVNYGSQKGSVNFAQKYLFNNRPDFDNLDASNSINQSESSECNSVQQFNDESSQGTFE
jgi:hypothetical protein